MKLLSAQIQNYRVHRETVVDFDGPLILLHGPNESGKSTLAEAIHAALFLKARGNTAVHARMQSDFGGDPTVSLEFEANGTRHSLKKVFGGRGQTSLASQGEAVLTGDNAEEALARLLGVDGSVSGGGIENKMQRRWAHLWVWQGKSSGSPIEGDSLIECNEPLREKLQARTGQSVINSRTDSNVIKQLQELTDATFRSNGEPKAGSALFKAEAALARARDVLAEKETILESLRRAADTYEQASADEFRYNQSLNDATTRIQEIRSKLETVRDHRERLKEKSREVDAIANDLKELTRADSEIRQLETDLEEIRNAAAPGQTKLETLQIDAQAKAETLQDATRSRESADESLQRCRAIVDIWQAQVNYLEQVKRAAELQATRNKITALQAEHKKLREHLAPLDAFTAKALTDLRKKANAAQQAQSRLEAYALNLKLLEADTAILLDGETVQPGASRTLTRTAELQIGERTRIRLSPGGAEDLQKAQDAATAAETALQKALRELTVPSVETAEEKHHERESVSRDLAAVQAKLEDNDAQNIDDALREAAEAAARHRARRDALVTDGQPLTFSDDRKAAEQALREAADASQKAEAARRSAETAEKIARKAAQKSAADLAQAQAEQQKQLNAARELETRLKVALEKSGDATARSQAINQKKAALDQAATARGEEHDALEALGPEQLELDRDRLEKSLKEDERNLANARDRKIEAQTELKNNGTRDPEREAKEAAAEVEQQEKRHAALLHQAEVRRYLLERLKLARQATTAALAKPLEEAVAPYLQLLFGGSQAKLHWAEDGSCLEGFEIDRTRNHNGLHAFDQLSHGTREQVALALRLALAEILAADHHGCLPLILDDAFTHADQHRREKLKTLLYRASQQGLQICLFTCHPENYSGLGAKENALHTAAQKL